MLPVVWCSLLACACSLIDFFLLYVVCSSLYTGCCLRLRSVVCCMLFVVCRSLLVVGCSSFGVWCLLSVISLFCLWLPDGWSVCLFVV